jgi:metallopeptidase family M12-like protein
MRRTCGVWVAVVVLCSSCIGLYGGTFGGGKSRQQAQHDVLAEFTPPGFDTDPVSNAQIKEVRVRVWADDEYRSQNTSWQRTCQQVFDEANTVLVAKLRLKLVPDYQAWDYRAPTGATLSDRLLDLVKQDGGDNVFAVIGFTGSLAIVEATFEELGVAHISGRHMVMRGYADIEERKAFRDAFPDLSKQEIERAHALRRQHKTAAVLLHELGHNLGVDHESAPDTMMNGGYSHNTTGFSEQALATMRGNIALHQGPLQAIPVANAQPASVQPASTPKPGQPQKSGNSIELIVTAKGQVMLGGNILVGAALRETLESAPKVDPGVQLVIQKAPGAPEDAVNDLKMRAQKAGFVYITTVGT